MKKLTLRVNNAKLSFFIGVLCTFFMGATQVHASWTSGGPPGGDVNCMAMATNPDVIYAGTETGIFKTVDGGVTWTKTGFPETSVRVVQVAPENPEPAINFDDVSAPCVFTETTALTNEYSALGVTFSGPGGNDGGAILDECAGGSITGHSSPNFLAFYINASLSNGGVPRGPETITFNPPVTYVKIKVGSVDGTLVGMEAYDALDNLIDSDRLYAFNTLKTMSVSGTGITTVVIDFPLFSIGTTLVLDDLAFVVQPVGQHPDIVYAGTDDGIYKSEDGGDTWTQQNGQSGELSGARVNAIAIDPLDPRILYAGTGWSDSDESGEIVGIFKSTDGGETWEQKLFVDEMTAVEALLIDSQHSSYIYAGVYDSYHGRGFYKSTDGGENWASRKVGSTSIDRVVTLAMTHAGFAPAAIYAVVAGQDVYKSDDRGETWDSTETPWISFFSPWSLAVDPNSPQIVYVGAGQYYQGPLYKSTDGANTWSIKANGLPTGPASIVIDPRNSDVYAGLPGAGVYKSTDEAESWNISSPNNTSIEGLAVHPASSDTLFAVVKKAPVATSTDGGISWDYLVDSPTDLGAVAVDPSNPSTIFVGEGMKYRRDVYVYKSTNGGQGWTGTALFHLFETTLVGVTDLWIDPSDSNIILVTVKGGTDFVGVDGGGVYRSTDGGTTWNRSPLGLTIRSATTLASDPTNPQILDYGTSGWGYVYKSTDGGSSWTRISPGGEWVRGVRDIEVDLNSHVYAATSEGLMKWDGSDWTELTGLPTDDIGDDIRDLAIDRSTSPGIVYVGSGEDGVFVSRDGGSTWIDFNEDLGNLSIRELAISASQPIMLYAGTAYGGVWSTVIADFCEGDFDGDGDVDGSDLAGLAADPGLLDLSVFAANFGRTDCP